MTTVRVMAGLLAYAPRGMTAAALALMIAASATESFGVLLLVQLLAKLEGSSVSESVDAATLQWLSFFGIPLTIFGLLSTFVVLITVKSVVALVRDHWTAQLQLMVIDNVRSVCLKALLEAEWRWVAPRRPADLANLVLIEVVRLGVGAQAALSLIAGLVAIVAYLAVAFVISPIMTGLSLSTTGLLFLALSGFHRQLYALGKLQSDVNRNLFQNLQSSLAAMKISKVLGNERKHLDILNATVAEVRRAQLQVVWNTSLLRAIFHVAGAAFLALYVYVGWTAFQIALPELLTLVFIFARLMPLVNGAQQQAQACASAMPALQEVADFLAESQRARAPRVADEAAPLPLDHEVEVRGVRLSYGRQARPVLDRVSLVLPARKVIALMGPSGAGKSTLADVIMGLVVPDAGHLLVDGVLVSGAIRRRWMQGIGYMPQESLILPGTVRDNLLWASPDADDGDLLEAIHSASADFVFSLPQGLDTEIGAGGIDLSGGERQRLSLARVLLQRPRLLVLDEPTSALDDFNVRRILATIKSLRGSVTVLLIGHSDAAAEIADEVVRMQEGRIISVNRRPQLCGVRESVS